MREGFMGKHEQLEELGKQLAQAKRKKKNANFGIVGILVTLIFGFLLPFLWILTVILFILVIVNYTSAYRRINELNLEMAKIK